MISLFIAGNLITVAQNNVSAKEKTADSNNVTRKDNQEYNFPEDIIEPGPELPMYLYPPSIEKITNTMNGIKIQWKKVENADGYRIQRKTGKDKWKDLKILKKNKYTDNAVRNGQNYRYRVYAYAVNSVDFIENTGIKSITKTRCKISWKQNKKADGYNLQISTSKQFKKPVIKKIKGKRKSTTNINIHKNKSYYVKVRAYKMDAGKTYYSAWSYIKMIK